MGRIKALIAISQVDKVLSQEWIVEYLPKDKFELFFILYNEQNSQLESFLKSKGIQVYRISRIGIRSKVKAFLKTFILILKHRPLIVHSHLRQSNVICLPAAYLAMVKKRIYTRHDSTFNHMYFPSAVKTDKLVNKLSNKIISISDIVTEVLHRQENVSLKKIVKLHHGFDFKEFENIDQKTISELKAKYNIKKDDVVIGVVARYIDWKGIEDIIHAFKTILVQEPNAKLILANAQGTFETQIKSALKVLPKESFIEIKFEEKIGALYQCFDIYVHCPINHEVEAFGQTYVEALIAGVPSVFTISGVAHEFIKHEYNALVVPYQDKEAISNAVLRLMRSADLKDRLSKNGRKSVEGFRLENFINGLIEIYES